MTILNYKIYQWLAERSLTLTTKYQHILDMFSYIDETMGL